MTGKSWGMTGWVLISLILTSSLGCSLFDKHKDVVEQEAFGTVQTGGQFAASRTLPIPQTGLTLQQAVDQSVRPSMRDVPPVAASTMTTGGVPLGLQIATEKGTIREQLEKLRELLRNNRDDPDTAEPFINKFAKGIVIGGTETERTPIIEKIEELVLEKQSILASDDSETIAFEDLVKRIESEIPSQFRGDNYAASPPVFVTDRSGIYYDLVVILQRSDGVRLVIPLWMVNVFSAGDILLSDGDIINVVHYNRTEVGSRQPGNDTSGSIVVSGFSNLKGTQPATTTLEKIAENVPGRLVSLADLVVVQHLNKSGQLEQYYLPLTQSGAYGDPGVYENWLLRTRLGNGDVVRVESLELSPLIRASKRLSINATADALLDDGTPEGRLAALMARKRQHRQEVRAQLRQLPIVGTVPVGVEEFSRARAGQIGLPRLVQ